MKPLYKTTVVLWSEEDPSETCELTDLARQATQGYHYCSHQKTERVEKPEEDPHWDDTEFFNREDGQVPQEKSELFVSADALMKRIVEDTVPNPATLTRISTLIDLLGLVCEEYVLRDAISELTKQERYDIAKWASVCLVVAGSDDPPLPRPEEPAALAKILLRPGRRVILSVHGGGVIERYSHHVASTIWPAGPDTPRPVVFLDNGGRACPTLTEIIGVEE